MSPVEVLNTLEAEWSSTPGAPRETAETGTSDPEATAPGATATFTLAPLPSETPAADASPTEEQTAVAAVITVTPAPPTPIVVPTPSDAAGSSPSSGIAPEVIAAALVLLLILGYLGLYMRGQAMAGRYAGGFVISVCPVCREGTLSVEARTERSLGIPTTRHVIRCSNCRSVLRESGGGRWRYAVDRAANPQLFDRLNNREVREDTLRRLLEMPTETPAARVVPEIVDEESPADE
jgi:hypothetical protein